MSLATVDIVKYTTKPIIAGGLLYLYDYFVEGQKIYNSVKLYDAGIMAGSILSSAVLKDLLIKMFNIDDNSMPAQFFEPLLNAILYGYGYELFLSTERNENYLRNPTTNYMIGGVLSMVINYFENPIVSLITGFNFVN